MESEVNTSCENCVFEEEQDCKLDKLSILAKNGALLKEQDGHTFIQGRLCNFKRDRAWWDQYQNDYLNQINKELEIKYGTIINASNVLSLSNAVDFIESQSIPTKAYYIIYYNDNFEKQSATIQEILKDTNKKWSIKRPLEKAKFEFEYVNEYISTGSFKEPYVLYIKDSNLPKSDLIFKLNKSINEELKQVMLYTDFDYTFAPMSLIKLFGMDYLPQAIIEGGHGDKITRI